MTTPYTVPVTAAQVGTYFVGQYYQVLQHQPDLVHQFYSDNSVMLRVDGTNRDTATTMLQIHTLIMSLNYTGIQIRTAHALQSWNGGVLVMCSGSVQLKDFNSKRKFVETFFLEPQQKGYFVLNDVFYFVDEEPYHHHPAVILSQSNLDVKLNAPSSIPERVSNYFEGGEIKAREFAVAAETKENGAVDNYSFPEQRLQQVPESENILEENSREESNGFLPMTVNSAQDSMPPPLKEPDGEPQKLTYASILRIAKAQSALLVAPPPSVNKNTPPVSDWNHASQPTAQQPATISNSSEKTRGDTNDNFSAFDDEDEIRSVYVRNLLPSASEAEIEEEFKNFGKIVPEGVVIRSRKDVGVRYAFVEFEDMSGVHNAIKAGSAIVAGRQVFIEERRPNSYIPSLAGRGRGRGRGSYQSDASRGRFGSRSFGRGGAYDGGDRDINRPRGNGYYRPSSRQGFSGHQVDSRVDS